MQSSYPPEFQRKPQVCVWYNVYCSFFLVIYVLTAIVGAAMALFPDELASASPELDKDAERFGNLILGIALVAISILLCILFIVGLLIPRKKWGWIYGFFPIAIGLNSPCCMLASIPLLIFWLKPATKRWFHAE